MHSLLVELHIHRKKQTEDDSFNFLNVTNECEKYFNLTLHHISPHDCFPEILWLIWGPRCRRHGWDIRIFPWRCRERPEIIDYGLMLCWLCMWDTVSDRLNIDKICDWDSQWILARPPSSCGDSWCRPPSACRGALPGGPLWRLCLKWDKWVLISWGVSSQNIT